MSDLIDRQSTIDLITTGAVALTIDENDDALDVMEKTVTQMKKWMVECIAELPSAQPDIIRCKECKHGKYDIFDRGMWCELHPSLDVTEDDFCSFAVMRKGGKNEI